jgi:hypothetical protein
MGGAAFGVIGIYLNRRNPMRVSVAASDRIKRRLFRSRVHASLSNE